MGWRSTCEMERVRPGSQRCAPAKWKWWQSKSRGRTRKRMQARRAVVGSSVLREEERCPEKVKQARISLVLLIHFSVLLLCWRRQDLHIGAAKNGRLGVLRCAPCSCTKEAIGRP